MRDYVLSQAQAFEATGAASWLSRLIRNWRARRSVSRLQEYDDFLLRDIGVTREEVRWAAGLPLNENAALALEDESRRRRNAAGRRV